MFDLFTADRDCILNIKVTASDIAHNSFWRLRNEKGEEIIQPFLGFGKPCSIPKGWTLTNIWLESDNLEMH